MKARGLNQDIFGHLRFCMEPAVLNPETIADAVTLVLREQKEIRVTLAEKLPGIREKALSGGEVVRKIIPS